MCFQFYTLIMCGVIYSQNDECVNKQLVVEQLGILQEYILQRCKESRAHKSNLNLVSVKDDRVGTHTRTTNHLHAEYDPFE